MPEPDREFVGAIIRALHGAADPEKAGPMQAYMKSEMPCLGVQRPQMTQALRPVFEAHPFPNAETWRATVLALFRGATHREEWYAALALMGRQRYRAWLNADALPLCETLIVEGAWWDIVDDVATRKLGQVLKSDRPALTPVLRRWASDESRWKRRASILVQLKYKGETDRGLLTHAIEQNLDDPDFFLRKGIGWALREFTRTDPDWVEAFVEKHREGLSNLSRREALRNLWKDGRALHLR